MMEQAVSLCPITRHLLGSVCYSSPSERICAAIQRIPAKVLARATGMTPKAAERWKAGDNSLSAAAIFALARTYEEVWLIVREACGRAETIEHAEAQLCQAANLLEGKSP